MKFNPLPLLLVMPLYWLFLCNHIFVVSGLCLDDQMSLLLQLKSNLFTLTSEIGSTKLKSWDPSDDCCAWMGVTCDKEGHVTGLDLSGEEVYGDFDNSSSLFSLKHLMNLNLANNDFSFLIPSGFNKLENLTYLNLSSSCEITRQIPTEISQLTRLVTLDLSYFSPYADLNPRTRNLQKLVQNLTSIRQLHLDGIEITASGKEWCNALLPLRGLQELSMAGCNLLGPLDSSLTTLQNLSVIIFNDNNFSSPVPETFAIFKNLTTLSLGACNLSGRFPPKIFQIATLSFIDISYNENLHGFFPDFPLSGSLQTIRVSTTNFSGTLPHSIGNLRHLSELQLQGCHFNGTLPNSLSTLTELTYLDLSSNKFTGPMASFGMAKKLSYLDLSNNGLSGAIPSSHFEALHNLVHIDLSHNFIIGSIPSSLFTLRLLQEIHLNDNLFSQLDEFRNVSSSTLSTLSLGNNNILGPFPEFIFQLTAISNLDLSSNKFHGPVQLLKFWELRNLYNLSIADNKFSVNVDIENVDPSPLPGLQMLHLSSCNLKTFPYVLRNQSTLQNLNLSNNQIQGIVPNWIWKLTLLYSLDISSNLITELEGPMQNVSLLDLEFLDLHNNQIQGPIPILSEAASYLDYSRNRFSSVIPDSICNAKELEVLDLSFNNISGKIPSCLMMVINDYRGLQVLNLRDNSLTGHIPDMIFSCPLRTLNLHGNHLHGQIPKSLAYCSNLEVLDLGKNQITGGFPCFLKSITALRVLVLRNNKFQGSLECGQANYEAWKMLQIVDIALNNFSGKLKGKYFTNWKAMRHDEDQHVSDFIHKVTENNRYYQDSITLTNKGQQLEFVKILTVFTSIDFSSNNFDGAIPKELMDFKSLIVLNLSNNALSGEIPTSIGNLTQLESLDLSHNSLHGGIPVQLASLTFLSYLNLSFNHLVGNIPTSTQIQSFEASSFEGNDGLRGPPLEPANSPPVPPLPPQQPGCRRLACSVDWNFLSAELGLVFGLGNVIGPLLFWKKWRIWYWKLVDRVLCWIFPQLYLDYVIRGGQRYTILRWWG